MSMKINKLEIENVKRVKAVKLEPTSNGLTIIGGNNNQGKTSVLDSIAWALGGEKFRPSHPQREGSVIDPYLKVTLSNGIIVERKGKNSSLKVTDPKGEKAGQQLLDSFIEKLALDLPKFMESSDAEKARTLLNIIGVGDKLNELEQQEKALYNERLAIGRIADQKKKFADEQEYYPDMPKELVSAYELIQEQQNILAKNGENQRKRDRLKEITYNKYRVYDNLQKIDEQLELLNKQKAELTEEYNQTCADEETAMKTVTELKDESTAELEKSLADIEETNRKIRANLDKDKAEDDARDYAEQYAKLTLKIETLRKEKRELLTNADLPLPELSVSDGLLTYKGQHWDNMSGSERLKVSTAIVRKLNPECGFVLVDKLEQMDLDNLKEFGNWIEQEGLQVIATRVSTGDECSIIITDGYGEETAAVKLNKWEAGKF